MIQVYTRTEASYSTALDGTRRLDEYTIEEDSYRLQESLRVVRFKTVTGDEVIIPLENIAFIRQKD